MSPVITSDDDQGTATQTGSAPGPSAPPDTAARLMDIVRRLALELHPRRKQIATAGLDSALDRDLGFDSLSRAELLLRLERAFGVDLPDRVLGKAETPRDLLHAVEQAEASAPRRDAAVRRPVEETVAEAPHGAATLIEALDWHVREHPDRPHILLTDDARGERTITYADLARLVRRVAAGLGAHGVEPGDRVAIMLPTGEDFFHAFFGALFAGAIPAPIYPPTRLSQLEEHMRRQAAILDNAGAKVLVTFPEAAGVGALLKAQLAELREVVTVDRIDMGEAGDLPSDIAPGQTALLQYTSGSTGDPKGVVLSHANLLANIRAMGETLEASSADRFVSWLPLYHDMGLIGAWLGSLYYAAPVAIMSPLSFLVRPDRWLWAIHRHRATLTAAPNFAFELCLTRIEDGDIEGLDLSSLRMVANGAEAVRPQTIRRFTERFAKYGFRPEAMSPMYGLAENSVGLALPPPGRGAIIDRVEREALTRWGEARPASPDDDRALEFVACGGPLPGHQIRIIDDTGFEAGERRVGRLEWQGPSATAGYYRNPEKTAELFDGEWLDSGDLAYVAGGDVFITGRIKDIILRGGRNIFPEEVEEAVGDIEGVRKGCVALFGSLDPRLQTERLVLVAETRKRDDAARAELRRRIEEVALSFLDMPPDEIVLAPPRSVPKTSSGKLRRAAAREVYEHGRVGTAPRAVWRQILDLTMAAAAARTVRAVRLVLDYLYAGYWWAVCGLAAATIIPLVLVLPHRRWRWAVMHGLGRLALRLVWIPVTVTGDNKAVRDAAIIVANHSSYVDSLVLCAVITGEMAFVAKKELDRGLVPGRFLQRLGAIFVERIETGGALESAQEISDAAARGERLVFYPEGTFTRMSGLLAFRLGAFMLAARRHTAIVPVTIQGTRDILRGADWFPRRGPIMVHIGQPLMPQGEDFDAALQLRDAARAAILDRVGEPDLAYERVTIPS